MFARSNVNVKIELLIHILPKDWNTGVEGDEYWHGFWIENFDFGKFIDFGHFAPSLEHWVVTQTVSMIDFDPDPRNFPWWHSSSSS